MCHALEHPYTRGPSRSKKSSYGKTKSWYFRERCNNIFLVPPNFWAMIRATVDGKILVQADTGSFESLDPRKQPKDYLVWTAFDWKSEIHYRVQGHDYPAECGLRPPPGIIEDMLAQNRFTIPDKITVDWENIQQHQRPLL